MGVKSLVQGLNAAATAGFEPRTFDPKSDVVTDWPLRLHILSSYINHDFISLDIIQAIYCAAWCSESGSLISLNARCSGAFQ